MTTINIHEAKTQFSKLIERVEHGETITIARAGKPVAQLSRLPDSSVTERRLGFMAGRFSVPDDFDTMGQGEIERSFGSR